MYVSSFYRFNKSFNQSLNDGARKKLHTYESDLEFTDNKTREYINGLTERILENEPVTLILFDFHTKSFYEEDKVAQKIALRNLHKANDYAKYLKSQLKFQEKQQQAFEVLYFHDRPGF